MFFYRDEKPAGRRLPKQRRSSEVYFSIIKAAEQLIEKKGYEKTTTNNIANRAGVSIGSLYQYFSDKLSVLSAIIDSRIEKHIDILCKSVEEVKDEGLDPYVETLLEACYNLFIVDRKAIKKYFLTEILMLRYKTILNARKRIAKLFSKDVQKYFPAKTSNEVDKNVELAVHALLGVIHGMIWHEAKVVPLEVFIKDGKALIKSYLE